MNNDKWNEPRRFLLIRFGRWSTAASGNWWFKRVYINRWRWTPFVWVQRRQVAYLGSRRTEHFYADKCMEIIIAARKSENGFATFPVEDWFSVDDQKGIISYCLDQQEFYSRDVYGREKPVSWVHHEHEKCLQVELVCNGGVLT